MTIHASDIKLRASVVMADVPEGGGGPGAGVIEWGQSNTIFNDVSSAARTRGEVSIRQLHGHVDTDNVDRLLGPYAIVAEGPDDDKVSVTLAKCGAFDTRSQIQTAIANYLIRGTQWAGFLLENHVQGQLNIQIFQRVGARRPTIGRTLVLVMNEDQPTEQIQYVRVIDVDVETRTFTEVVGGTLVDFDADVVTCALQSPLAFAFAGSPPSRLFQAAAGKTLLRDTTEADASNYYGMSRLRLAASINDTTLHVESVYSQLVPNSQTSKPTLDQRPAGRKAITLASSPREVTAMATPHTYRIKIGQENRGLSYVAQLTPLPEAQTVVISWVGLGNHYSIEVDADGELQGDGAGILNRNTGSLAISLPSLPDVGSAIVITWGERVAYTDRSNQGALVRRPEYVFQLQEEGYKRGTLQVSWSSGSEIKTATAAADGTLSGDATGHVDAPSGRVWLQTAHMIDSGGQFSLEYETETVVEQILSAPALDAGGFGTLNLASQPLAGSVELSWTTVQEVSETSGAQLTEKEAAVSSITDSQYVSYRGAIGQYVMITNTKVATSTYTAQSSAESTTRVLTDHTLSDDGDGGFVDGRGTVDYSGQQIVARFVTQGRSATAYKADTADVTLITQGDAGADAGNLGGEYSTAAVSDEVLAASTIRVRYKTGAPGATAQQESVSPPPLYIDLCPYTTDRIVAGSLQFVWMGETWRDYEGQLYRGGAGGSLGIPSGSVNYLTGIATLTDYTVGANPQTITLQSLWTQKGDWRTSRLFFMTDAHPIQPGQITITVTDVNGDLINVAADLSGNLTGDHALGKIEFQNGLAELVFGDLVDDSALSQAEKAEWWYSPGAVGEIEAGKIWRPWPVDPASLRYNAVSNFYLPIDPEILGLDPVRLPQDGRVPVFKPGRILILGHDDALAPDSYTNGQTVSIGRTRLSRVWLIDNNGQLITEGWTADEQDLDAGQIHIVDVGGWAQPVTIHHRVQDMTMCTDVQIDGTIGVNIPVSHTYPLGSVLSSAVEYDDLFARALPPFDQQSWDGITWSDSVQGNEAVASYNSATFPIEVSNAGALTERWALRIRVDGTSFDLIGEHLGQIDSGSINSDFEPNNPFDPGKKLFKLLAAGWGSGWVAGNVLRFNTVGAMQPMACVRTVQPGQAAADDYAFEIFVGGDIDRPPNDAV